MKLLQLLFSGLLFTSLSTFAQSTPQEYDDYYTQLENLKQECKEFRNSNLYTDLVTECESLAQKLGTACPYHAIIGELTNMVIFPPELNGWLKDNINKTNYKSYEEAIADIEALESKSKAVFMAYIPIMTKAQQMSKKYKGFFIEFLGEVNNPYSELIEE